MSTNYRPNHRALWYPHFSLETETSGLIDPLAGDAKMSVGDIALAAAAFALSRWAQSNRIAIDVESHGRYSSAELDTSRSVGWFTTFHQVLFEIGKSSDPALFSARSERA